MAKKATRKRRRKGRRGKRAIAAGVGLSAALLLLGVTGKYVEGHTKPLLDFWPPDPLSRTLGEAGLVPGVAALQPGANALRRLSHGSGPIPFAFLHDHVFVTADLAGRPGTWLVDTGANLTVISPRAADLAALPAVNARADSDPYGITRFVSAGRLAIGAAHAPLLVAGIMPKLEDQILRSDGVLVDGILGFDWLRNFRLQIDYPARILTLLPPGPPPVPLPHRHRIPMRIVNGVPLVPVRIDRGPTRDCLLDTGSNVVNLRWDLARASGIRPTDPGVGPGPRISGLAASANTQALRLASLTIGKVTFRQVRVSLYSGNGVSARYGNLGNTLFMRGRLTLDPRNHQVDLEE